MSATSPRLPAQMPTATSTIVCPLCGDWTLEFPHEPGAGLAAHRIASEHLDECPAVPRGKPRKPRSLVGRWVDSVLALIR